MNNNRVKKKCKTVFVKNVLEESVATYLYDYLKRTVQWSEGIKGKHGTTRKGYVVEQKLNNPIFLELQPYIETVLEQHFTTNYDILGVYLNYYENGRMYTPTHSHPGSDQLVISLGCSRILKVGKKEYTMENGDAIIFGSSSHSVPKSDTSYGRISIATFMVPN